VRDEAAEKYHAIEGGLGEGGEEGRDNDIVGGRSKRMFDAGEHMWPEDAPFHADLRSSAAVTVSTSALPRRGH